MISAQVLNIWQLIKKKNKKKKHLVSTVSSLLDALSQNECSLIINLTRQMACYTEPPVNSSLWTVWKSAGVFTKHLAGDWTNYRRTSTSQIN